MTPTVPRPRSGILEIEPYVPGGSVLESGAPPIKLSANESPLGPSKAAEDAYAAAVTLGLHRYPDGGAGELRTAIAKRYGLDPERIICGAGSDELISLLAQGYLGPGDEAIYTQFGFLVYSIVIKTSGATPVVAPERDYCTDVDSILACVSSKTKMVYLANPNNPTGTYIGAGELRRLRENLPKSVILVIDAAYAEYMCNDDYDAGLELCADTTNTVMTRTFSKIYGLAALRLGWAYCPVEIAGILNRIRTPFNVTAPGIAAGAAAIADIAHERCAVEHNQTWMPWLGAELERIGIKVTSQAGNFVLAHFPNSPVRNAQAADAFLKSKSIIVRGVAAYGLPDALRITVGTADENKAVVAALNEFMEQSP